MSDDIANALQSAGRSSSVLGAIANPPQVNPLAALSAGTRVAGQVYELRQQQANEAAGKAYQGAIDQQTGEFDPNKFRTLLAQSGPAAMAAGAALLNTQNISSNQLDQNLAKAKWVNAAAGAALQSGDFSDAAMLRLFQTGIANGTLTMPEVQRQMQLLPPDAAGRRQWLQEHQMTSASVQQQLEQTQGTQQTITTPQGTYTVNVPPISRGMTIVTPHAPTPGETVTAKEPYDDQGLIPRDANGNPTRPPKGYVDVPKPVTAVPGVPTGGPPTAVPSTTSAPPSTTAPPPPPRGTQIIKSPGAYVAPESTPPASPAPASPAATPPAATPASPFGGGAFSRPPVVPPATPATTPPVVAPASGTPATSAPPATADARPPVFTSPPQGQPAQIEQDQKLYGEHVAQMDANNKRSIAGKTALDALELARSGPGSGGWARTYAWLQAQGVDPGVSPNDYTSQAAWQVMAKNLLRFAQDNSKGAHTDLGLETQLHSNANAEEMLPAANRHVVLQDMGILRQQMAMTKGQDPSANGYRDRVKNFPTDTDPVAFAWDLMTGPERQSYYDSIKGNKSSLAKWEKSMQIAKDTGVWSAQPQTQPPPQKQSFLSPAPQPQQNPLTMAA